MKNIFIIIFILLSSISFYAQNKPEKINIRVDGISGNQVWYLNKKGNIERLDSLEVKLIEPDWIKEIKVQRETYVDSIFTDTTFIYIKLKKRFIRNYMIQIESK